MDVGFTIIVMSTDKMLFTFKWVSLVFDISGKSTYLDMLVRHFVIRLIAHLLTRHGSFQKRAYWFTAIDISVHVNP